jgi:Holliday junction resolvasome RuvABC endonuclease subunit
MLLQLIENNLDQIKLIQGFQVTIPGVPINLIMIGCDPGSSSWGVSLLNEGEITCFEIKLKPIKNKFQRYILIEKILEAILLDYEMSRCPVILEGPNYNPKFREATLDEARNVLDMFLQRNGWEVTQVAPKSVRKAAFGNGNKKAEIFYPELPGDLASSIACLLYGVFTFAGIEYFTPNITSFKEIKLK